MKVVYKFHWDCGRMGEVNSVFVADPKDVKKAIGKNVYFGEILGKHSEIYGTLDETDLELATDDPEFVATFEKLELSTGYNPLEYINEDE